MSTDCNWERFRAARAAMPTQQRELQLCRCKACTLARSGLPNLQKRSAAVAERRAVLAWKPPPSPDEEPAA